MKTLSERLKWLRKKRDLSSKAIAAQAMGIKYGTYQRYEYGAEPSRRNYKIISEFYGCSLPWLMTGEGDPFPGQSGDFSLRSSAPNYTPVQPDFPADDFVFIRQVNGRISAGGGLIPDYTADLVCAFRKDWVKRQGGKPDTMSLIKVQGDSMAPTLIDGDLVLVNHSRSTVAPQGGIYAISIDSEIMIKRIQVLFPQNKLRILSDNAHYEPIETDIDQVKINGKVIWFGRNMDK